MRKFSLFGRLGLFGLFIDAGEGGGSSNQDEGDNTQGKDDNSHRDIELKDEDIKSNDKDKKLKDLEEKLNNIESTVSKREQEEAVSVAVSSIKKDYPTFDENKIIEKLKEINKTDPKRAESLNNPSGWELLHLKHFQTKDVDNDDFDGGRNNKPQPFDHDEALSKAKTGDTKALSALYENSISTSSKR